MFICNEIFVDIVNLINNYILRTCWIIVRTTSQRMWINSLVVARQNVPITFITTRKQSLQRLCFYRCLSVHRGAMRGCCGGVHGCSGGHVWLLLGGMHGCSGGMCGCSWGGHARLLTVGRAWLLLGGVCMVALGGHAWLLLGGHAWDTMRYGQWVGGMHPTGMHSCSQWDYIELMNRLWCPLFADWLERNNMNCFFRKGPENPDLLHNTIFTKTRNGSQFYNALLPKSCHESLVITNKYFGGVCVVDWIIL